jgi:hypothetical protein
MFCTAQRGDGVLGLGMGVLVAVAFCAFEVGVEDGNWTGPDREGRKAYKGCIKIGNGRVYIKSDCTVRRRCNCYLLELEGILHLQAQTINTSTARVLPGFVEHCLQHVTEG